MPPNKETLGIDYEKRSVSYQQLIDEVCYIIGKSLKERGIKVSAVEFRLKDFEQFYSKILRKEYTGDLFDQVEDIAGVRIICLYRSDLEKLEALVKDKFEVIRAETMHSQANLVFGYMSDHYIVKLPSHYSGERYDTIKSLKCEIQVRTVASHAWATVSHELEYKQEIDIPSELKNDFNALSGVFYIADSLFEQFKLARLKSINKLTKSIEQRGFNLDDEVNSDTLKAYLCWKFPDREVRRASSGGAVSNLLSEMRQKGVKSFRELDTIVDSNMEWFLKKERNSPPYQPAITIQDERGKRNAYLGVGVARVILRERVER